MFGGEGKEGVRINFPNEIWIVIFEIFLRDQRKFQDLFKLRRTCKRWNELIPVIINDTISYMLPGRWSINVCPSNNKYLGSINEFYVQHPIYDATTNLVCYMNLTEGQDPSESSDIGKFQRKIDFLNEPSFTFELRYCRRTGTEIVGHKIDSLGKLGKKKGERIFHNKGHTYCIKVLKGKSFVLTYWKIHPKIWFNKFMISRKIGGIGRVRVKVPHFTCGVAWDKWKRQHLEDWS